MSKTAKPVRSATDPVEAKRRDLIFPMQTELQAAFLLMAQDLAGNLPWPVKRERESGKYSTRL